MLFEELMKEEYNAGKEEGREEASKSILIDLLCVIEHISDNLRSNLYFIINIFGGIIIKKQSFSIVSTQWVTYVIWCAECLNHCDSVVNSNSLKVNNPENLAFVSN